MLFRSDLVIRDDRAYLEDKHLTVPIQVSRPRNGLSLAEVSGNLFLPPEGWDNKIGEVDFSPDEVFIKRVLRDLKVAAPSILETAQFTERLISRYCAAFTTAQLTDLQRHRLSRLTSMAAKSQTDVGLLSAGMDALLSLEVVSQTLLKAKEEAERIATERIEAKLGHLRSEQCALESNLQALNADISGREEQLKTLAQQQAQQVEDFESKIKESFDRVAEQPLAFLADHAIIRAALGSAGTAPVKTQGKFAQHVPAPSDLDRIDCSELMCALRDRLTRAGVSQFAARALLASIVSGHVPILCGSLARDTLNIIGDTVAGGRVFWLSVTPALTSPSELASVLLSSESPQRPESRSLADLLEQSRCSSDLSVLVMDNANLGQVDSVLVPLFRTCASGSRPDVVAGSSSADSGVFLSSTPVGSWPSNLLVAGIFIDSPLALPISRELWSVSTFIDTDEDTPIESAVAVSKTTSFPSRTAVSWEDWMTWQGQLKKVPPTDLVVLSGVLADRLRCGPQVRRRLISMAQSTELLFLDCAAETRLSVFVQCAVTPRCLSRGISLKACLQGEVTLPESVNETFERARSLFIKWGLDSV